MTVKRVGIAGSGVMGSGIAECAALSGHQVVLRSRRTATAGATLRALEQAMAKRVARGRLDAGDRDAALARISATAELDALADCDLVIESVVEDLAAKKLLFRELGRVCSERALLATNTSTLPVVDLAMETGRPERVCGIHFFNPAPAMALVEVVRPLTASPATMEEARGFVEACGKTAVEVADRAGFVVNALLFPYLNNAVRLLEAGVATKEDIDTAMRGGCGFPMGPFALLDLVGLDTSVAILDALHRETADPNYAPATRLRRLVSAGRLGRKSGEGFYEYGQA
ncbi:MAG: 3-hydroxyacyl-CoA dehydrogenase family protein [Acidimicrobiales bacterium]